MEVLAMDRDTERLTIWLITQPNLMSTVAAASTAMGWDEARVVSAADDGYWLFLHTFDGVLHVLADGE